jgi:hypothetical protein
VIQKRLQKRRVRPHDRTLDQPLDARDPDIVRAHRLARAARRREQAARPQAA